MSDVKQEVLAGLYSVILELSRDDIAAIREAFDARIEQLETAVRLEAKEKILALADQAGISLPDLLRSATTQTWAPLPAKYRNPDNPEQTWAGRGKRPAWFVAQLANGATFESLRIAV